MLRVPASATTPTNDDTFRVGLLRWLLAHRAERLEWARRRNAAARREAAAKVYEVIAEQRRQQRKRAGLD